MIVLIDNGHGVNTPGKCSPDGLFREYRYTREIAAEVVKRLRAAGYDARRIVEEEGDVSLSQRVARVNAICDKFGNDNVLLVSIHCNAAGGDGKWKSAGGWCVYTSPGKTKADDLATALWNAANEGLKSYKERFPILQKQGAYDSRQKPMRADRSDGDPDFEARFYILVHTKCAAVLTESLFQDNKADCDFLLSEEGTKEIVELHANGIINYIKQVKNAKRKI